MNLDGFVFQSARPDSEERAERRTELTKRNLRDSNSEGGEACVECIGVVGDQLVDSATGRQNPRIYSNLTDRHFYHQLSMNFWATVMKAN